MPRDDTAAIINFVQLCRRNGEPEHRLTPYSEALRPKITAELPRPKGNVLLSERLGVLFPGMVANMDQTSMPFAFLEGRTYATKGAKDVRLKSAKSGWSRQKATLMITIFADGIAQIPPIILFNGKSDSDCTKPRTQREQAAYNAECASYHPGVVVLFDTEAYCNEDVTLWWTLEYLIPTMPNERPVMAEIPHGRTLPSPQYPSILALDVVRFQPLERVKSLLRQYNVASAAIPGNCTSEFQPLDVCFNSLFKRHLKQWMDEGLQQLEDEEESSDRIISRDSALGKCRVLVTHAVGEVWQRFVARSGRWSSTPFKKLISHCQWMVHFIPTYVHIKLKKNQALSVTSSR
jgi:hypothetical protein